MMRGGFESLSPPAREPGVVAVRSLLRHTREVCSGAIRSERLVRWGAKGLFAVVDQALFAGSNLLVNVLLARWLAPEDYGTFVTSYTVLMLIGVLHSGLLTEPLLVFGANRYRESFFQYFRLVRRYHWRMMFVSSSLLAAVACILLLLGDFGSLAVALGGLAIAAPVILLNWVTRRACYATTMPQWAALGGAVHLILCAIGLTVLSKLALLSVLAALILVAVAALLATACMIVPLRRVACAPLPDAAKRSVWAEHAGYGRWDCATGMLNWVHSYVYYLVLPLFGGFGATGSLKAASNLIMPALQTDSALIALLTPAFARNLRPANRLVRLVGASASGLSVKALVYGVVLVIFGRALVEWLYEGSYQYGTATFIGLAVLPFLNGNVAVCSAALRARNQPEAIFWTAVLSVIPTTLGLVAISRWGVAGAVVGWNLNAATQLAAVLWFLTRPAPRT